MKASVSLNFAKGYFDLDVYAWRVNVVLVMGLRNALGSVVQHF